MMGNRNNPDFSIPLVLLSIAFIVSITGLSFSCNINNNIKTRAVELGYASWNIQSNGDTKWEFIELLEDTDERNSEL